MKTPLKERAIDETDDMEINQMNVAERPDLDISPSG